MHACRSTLEDPTLPLGEDDLFPHVFGFFPLGAEGAYEPMRADSPTGPCPDMIWPGRTRMKLPGPCAAIDDQPELGVLCCR